MKILVINGNTYAPMTANIDAQAKAAARADSTIETVQPEHGPRTIETYYDEYLAIPGVLACIVRDLNGPRPADAYILACWGDPGIEAARELTRTPVIGIAEASLLVANSLGAKFGVVTTLARTQHMVEKTVEKVGLSAHCSAVICTDLPVRATEDDRGTAVTVMAAGARQALAAGAEVIVLGCAGMSGLDTQLEAELGVTVIDSVAAAVVYAEALAQLGKRTSKRQTYKAPELKEIPGYPDYLQPANLPMQ